MNLTSKELNLLNTLKDNNSEDDYNCDENSCWFTVECFCDNYGYNVKEYRGVLASLLKKGVVFDLMEEAPDGTNYYCYDWSDQEEVSNG